jgi:NAD(P)H-dependent flavin oxidoreductase YrpB (nitropropane dioxygenase family)
MSRFACALLSMIFFAGMAYVSEVRAAAAVCDVDVCTNKYCKNAKAGNAQRCTSNCLISIDQNKKKGLCK